MFKRYAALLLLGTALAGCSATTTPDTDDTNTSTCSGGKCDAFAPRALESVSTTFGTCTVNPDTETADEFFALDRTNCTFVNFEDELPLHLNTVIVEAKELTNERFHSQSFDKEELDGTERGAFNLRVDGYPLRMNVRPIVYLDQTSGSVAEPTKSGTYLLPKITVDVLERPTAPSEHTFQLPFEMFEIAVWPTKEFADRFVSEELRFGYLRMHSELEIEDRTKRHSHSRHFRTTDELALLGNTIFHLAVEQNGVAVIELNLGEDFAAGAAAISKPGYYLIEEDGSLTEATPADIEARGYFLDDAEPTPPADDPTVADEEPPVTDPVDPEPAVDPCNGTCDATEACVAAECVALEDQRQTSCSASANAACEEDADCASGNVCAADVCRLRECQTQSSQCYDARQVCEQDTDCADGHACADGLCRRLSCQTQSSQCYDARQVCEQNTDCDSGHACVEGLCRRLSCQTQSSQCYDARQVCAADDHCDSGHACVEGLCRRLSCQTQATQCYDARQVCAADDDCADAHVCQDGLCHRTSCID